MPHPRDFSDNSRKDKIGVGLTTEKICRMLLESDTSRFLVGLWERKSKKIINYHEEGETCWLVEGPRPSINKFHKQCPDKKGWFWPLPETLNNSVVSGRVDGKRTRQSSMNDIHEQFPDIGRGNFCRYSKSGRMSFCDFLRSGSGMINWEENLEKKQLYRLRWKRQTQDRKVRICYSILYVILSLFLWIHSSRASPSEISHIGIQDIQRALSYLFSNAKSYHPCSLARFSHLGWHLPEMAPRQSSVFHHCTFCLDCSQCVLLHTPQSCLFSRPSSSAFHLYYGHLNADSVIHIPDSLINAKISLACTSRDSVDWIADNEKY